MQNKEVSQSAHPPRRRGHLRGLLAVNGALLVLLGAVTFGSSADAQNRTRGNYTMIGGGAKGSASGVVYIVDTTNQELIGLTFEPSLKELQGVGYRNLGIDKGTLSRPGRSR